MQEKSEVSMADLQVERIRNEITQRANQLKLTDPSSVLYSKWYRLNMRIVSFFIRLHNRLSKNEVYMKSIGAWVLYFRSKRSDYRTVRFFSYLPMQNEKFIESLYNDVLNREVDLLSFESMMAALKSSPDSKIDIGYDLNLSAEASLSKTYIQGVYIKKVMLDAKRCFVRWFHKPVTLFFRIKNRLYRMFRRDQT
jgi:hypothetical protein